MRPTGKTCARCLREVSNVGWADRVTKCEHLENTYDNYVLKTRGTLELGLVEEAEVTQELVEYALNRMLALDRDNGNKAEGKPASRIYKSRNTRTADALASRCHVRKGPFGCMRSAGHEGEHKF